MRNRPALALLLTALSPAYTHAVTASVTGLAIDSLIVTFTAFLINTLIPFIAICAIIWFVYRTLNGHRYSDFAVRFVIAMTVLALGIPGVSRMFGGTIVTSFIL